MKKFFVTGSLISFFFLLIFFQFNCRQNETKKEMTKEEKIERGKYLVSAGGCSDCHSPKVMSEMGPVPDSTLMLSGYHEDPLETEVDPNLIQPGKWVMTNNSSTMWAGPWGISFAANLTPDPETGLGNWTEEVFIKALRSGKHMGIGRPIMPPMPWPSISLLTNEDLSSVFAYLQTIKPIHNKVPDFIPFNMIKTKKM